jgi:Flp pilus assembly protein TadG
MAPTQMTNSFFRRFMRTGRGNVLILFALMAVVLVASVGLAVDYSRTVHFRNTLQGEVDAAAIAGAAAYLNSGKNGSGVPYSAVAQDVAIRYISNAQLPIFIGSLNVTATPSATSAGFFMTVTASAPIATTFMAIFTSTIPISATATAKNAIFNIQLKAGGWNSNAYDLNTVYWYLFDPNNNVMPQPQDLHIMYSNQAGFDNSPTINISASATQQIAFAMVNTTGGLHAYARNGYGANLGSTQTFYSHYASSPVGNYTTPNSVAYPNAVWSANYDGRTNCSLEITTGIAKTTSPTDQPSTPTFPVPHTGTCNNSSNPNFSDTQKFAASSCSSLNSSKTTTTNGVITTTYNYTFVGYNWNDMGGGSEDYDFNDASFYMSCPSPTGQTKAVVLTQ